MRQIFEIGLIDKNGVQIRIGDTVMAGVKDYKGNIGGWSKEIVAVIPATGEIALTPFGRKVEFMKMQTLSECLEVVRKS